MTNKIVIVAGDPNSINSEIIYKTWKHLDKKTRNKIYLIANFKLISQQFKKLKLKINLSKKNNLKADIEIDGGVNFDNCSEVKNAGANILVSGSTIFKENQGNLKKNIEILRNN